MSCLAGQLGTGVIGGAGVIATTPVAVADLSGVSSISAGIYHACAGLTNGTAACWGVNYNGERCFSTTLL